MTDDTNTIDVKISPSRLPDDMRSRWHPRHAVHAQDTRRRIPNVGCLHCFDTEIGLESRSAKEQAHLLRSIKALLAVSDNDRSGQAAKASFKLRNFLN